MMPCLMVEDNPVSALNMKYQLNREFVVNIARDGEEALSLNDLPRYRFILLDLGLPKLDGLSVLRRLRQRGVSAPIIIVSCRDAISDRVEALRAGADDYVTKPFAPEELFARIRAKLRRPPMQVMQLRVADLEMDCVRRTVRRAQKLIQLCSKQFLILECLMRNAGQPVTRAMILEHIWNYEYSGSSNVVNVYISQLRRKIDDGHPKELIHTVHGTGYTIMDPEAASVA
jgi:two-component system, OmpR family, copper resistance phosphate regulon response regulator CusR